ncbi:hypothetical protein BD413DRAFT_132264 [Trametes elegans]|nr:hypothetical protein BD413DRAFT_132264 [Trametes elegans]
MEDTLLSNSSDGSSPAVHIATSTNGMSASSPPASSSPAPSTPQGRSGYEDAVESCLGTLGDLVMDVSGRRLSCLTSAGMLGVPEPRDSAGSHPVVLDNDLAVSSHQEDLGTSEGQQAFTQRLNKLLLAAQEERVQLESLSTQTSFKLFDAQQSTRIASSLDSYTDSNSLSTSASATIAISTHALPGSSIPGSLLQETGSSPHKSPLTSRKRARANCRSLSTTELHRATCEAANHSRSPVPDSKKQRLTKSIPGKSSRSNARNAGEGYARFSGAGLTGTFGLRYAKGAGSLRRAESLRAGLPAPKTRASNATEVCVRCS